MKSSVITLSLLFTAASVIACSATGRAPKPEFTTGINTEPAGDTAMGVIYVSQTEDEKRTTQPLLEIPNGVGGLTSEARAKIICQRAEDATAKNDLWYEDLHPDRAADGQWILTSTTLQGKHLVTIDAQYMRFLKHHYEVQKEKDMADILAAGIIQKLDPSTGNVLKGPGKDMLVSHYAQAINDVMLGTVHFNEYLKHKSQLGSLEQARSQYESAVQENPHFIHAMQQEIAVLRLQGRANEAQALKERMDNIQKGISEIEKGNDAGDDKNWPEAIVHFKNAIAEYPGCISFYLLLADAYQENHDKVREQATLKGIPAVVLNSALGEYQTYVKDRLKDLSGQSR